MVITVQNISDILIGTIILLVGIVCCVIISNKIMKLFTSNSELNIILFFIYLLLIVLSVLFLQYILSIVIVNPKIEKSVNSLTGPLIGASSLFLTPTISKFVKQL